MRKVIAQKFKITGAPRFVDSVYLSSVGVMFKARHSTAGISVAICEVVNDIPDLTKILPFSVKHLESSQITPNSNATINAANLTQFTFEGPVRLMTNKEYALILSPDGGRREYGVWKGTLGAFDVVRTTNGKLTNKIPPPSGPITLTGFMRSDARGRTFTLVKDKFLQFAIYRYKFTGTSNTSLTGSVTFRDVKTRDYFTVANTIGLSNNILVGDVLLGGNTTVPNAQISGIISFVETNTNKIYINNSTGNFTAGTTNSYFWVYRLPDNSYSNTSTLQISAVNTQISSQIANGLISSIDNIPYHAVVPKFDIQQPSGTSYSLSLSTILGPSASYTQVPSAQIVNKVDNELTSYSSDRYLISYSNNPSLAYPSLSVTATLNSNSDYVSPSILPSDFIVVTNQLDSTTANTWLEYTNYGTSKSKYISKPIILADGQDSEDLKVYMTAYRPPSSDVKVYARFLSGQDSSSIADKTWTELVNENFATYSDQLNEDNYVEYTFSMPNYVNDPTVYFLGTGTITTSNTSNVVTGSGTTFNTQLQPTNVIYNSSNVFIGVVSAVTNSTQITLSSNSSLSLTSNVFNYASEFIPPKTNAFLNDGNLVTKSGNVAVSNSSALVTGTGTAFNTEFAATNYVSIDGETRYIVSIANSTSMTVDKPFTYSNTVTPISQVLPSGLTYTDANGTTFVKYKAFQIKVVLLGDSGVLYPKINDIRAIALQS